MKRSSIIPAALAAASLGASAAAQPEPSRQRTVELAHQVVAAAAIETLPKQIKGFYKAHRAEMPSLALEPEFPVRGPDRRFLVDKLQPFPFADLPRTEASLQSKYGDRTQGVGRLPWLIQESYARLVDAMKEPNKEKILAESDVLAGLIAATEADPDLATAFREGFLKPRRDDAKRLLKLCVDDGSLRPDLDLEIALDVLSGALYNRRCVTREPITPRVVEKMLEYVFEGLAARR